MKNFNLGLLFIRLGLGICLFLHGFHKITNGIGGVKAILVKSGLSEILAYGVYFGEVLAPLMLIIGFYSRISASIIIATSLFIIYAAYPNPLEITNYGGFKAEILYLYICMAFCIVFCGSGKYAVKQD
ncbi:DoxX family protein [Campylobacter sp. RM9344]|uniref:DoxX family protein n=1 Tax=Campylobacter californiensis TaxID=1032243 RepID=A0AAW3ZUK8_9BACT|nr:MULTISPECIES: DoxX family protein [unclassified Campylobacter]MBE2984889.1 DoxX family protein [Campylobacter sp. RM6883]MBE2986322.1 DoxX family protein [Campylobacter sp. RM12919]MBE2988047.1 DoxX family protein [Campylobacter sp. RM12920]MBE2995335.1 DoxX family protein [Campylobacter sp. RM6913]MBE3029330.1 DoxX family protein [Campylobacter sp. RM9344]